MAFKVRTRGRELALQAQIKKAQFQQRRELNREAALEREQIRLDRDIAIAQKRRAVDDRRRRLRELKGSGRSGRVARVVGRTVGISDARRKRARSAFQRFFA